MASRASKFACLAIGDIKMRLIHTPEELNSVLALLPEALSIAQPGWDVLKRSAHVLTCDLIFSHIVSPSNLRFVPYFLRRIGEARCFVFNHQALLAQKKSEGCAIAFEISASDTEDAFEFRGAEADPFLSVFYFTGDFGIVSSERLWLIFARTDDLALFSADQEVIYAEFNRLWWPSVFRSGSGNG